MSEGEGGEGQLVDGPIYLRPWWDEEDDNMMNTSSTGMMTAERQNDSRWKDGRTTVPQVRVQDWRWSLRARLPMQYQMVISAMERMTRSCDQIHHWEAELISLIESNEFQQSTDDIERLSYICHRILLDKEMDTKSLQK